MSSMAFLAFLAGAALGGLAGYGLGAWTGPRYYYYAPYPVYASYAPYSYAPYFAPPPVYQPYYYPRPYIWNPYCGYW